MINPKLSRIQNNPRPLIDGDRKVVFLWSAKVGCTFILKWFYNQNSIVVGDQAEGLQHYRANVYYDSLQYKTGYNDFLKDHSSFAYVKFIRNPYERAVSSYVHFLKKANTNDVMAKKFLNVEKIKSDFKFSFKEFIEVLSSKDINLCNVHWRCQIHPLERTGYIKIDHIVDIKNSLKEIPIIEKKYNFNITGKQMLLNFRNRAHHSSNRNKTKTKNEQLFVGNIKYDWKLSEDRPPITSFYNDRLKRQIFKIYRDDFRHYSIPR